VSGLGTTGIASIDARFGDPALCSGSSSGADATVARAAFAEVAFAGPFAALTAGVS
jgi:hypothetical protein